jgi:hypothetical protein
MPKYTVGFTYTVWVDVEAEDAQDAIAATMEVDYNYVDVHNTNARMELNEYDDPIVIENDDEEEDIYRNTASGTLHLG